MGSALYVSIKDAPASLDVYIDGKALARAWDALNPVAELLGVPNFDKLTTTAWKAPDKSLPIFEAYRRHIAAHPDAVPDADEVLEDLQDIIRLVSEAARLGTKWRLLLDH